MMDRETQRQFERLREQVQLMAGERGSADKAKTAVRRGELLALASLTMAPYAPWSSDRSLITGNRSNSRELGGTQRN